MIRQLLHWLIGDVHDPAWKPTGVKRDLSKHDESKAKASAVRAAKEDTARMKLAAKRTKPAKPKAKPTISLTRWKSKR